ncbi:MAG: bifunctional [glutamate--ammonia ligase]-adenylyl-L-tyrosine phosphorylase/[glutamate--ammonia-ligase] adenylyltransferase [Lysobacteraceae bacterium]|nr:MAG: bifunctional [glutamate--ammonia ligase]-adenylyl-L-tyrosine phosphorylase/[glutamate--ammonia-ligase] adenylyltransferase [Xanthomonadaceae bacterium]
MTATSAPDEHALIDTVAERALARLRAASAVHAEILDAAAAMRVADVVIASDFALDVFLRRPELMRRLLADDGGQITPPPRLAPDLRAEWPTLLRRFRQDESVRLIWRDIHGLDSLEQTLAETTRLAEDCLRVGLAALEVDFAQRYGVPRDSAGLPLRLVVFALGKLGGGELNFSSDIDLVYAYESAGEPDAASATGSRSLATEDYFARVGQQLAKLLDEVTAEGFCHRVDLRLRPFGTAGRIALSFAAMEQYFQREGRDWERYAWQKARAVAGDIAAGARFLETLRPFVYRRYLDYGALDGLREMKAAIAAEVARKDLADDIKRGPGGIREIEFLAQALQLIRGGREPALRERRLQQALRALSEARHLTVETAQALTDAYRFLRLFENRLQMRGDTQTQQLPTDALGQARIAHGMRCGDWEALARRLQEHRERVSREFDALLAPRRERAAPGALAAYWRALPDDGEAVALRDAGFGEAEEADRALRDFARAPGVRDLSDATRGRLDRLMPALLEAAAASAEPRLALRRLLAVLNAILRRASYLALLDERPAAMSRLVDVLSRSALLGERLAAHPLLLDELLDTRVAGPPPTHADFVAACAAAAAEHDLETALLALNEARQAHSFRIALATLDRRQPPVDSARQLAWLADAILNAVHTLARRELRAAHGEIPNLEFVILGYGSLGGEELGFGSDLDLVFLYAAPADAVSDGARPLDAPRWSARLAQKVVALLDTPTGAGRLYEVDVRLRPDGAKGLLVSTLASFEDYQTHRAWTWEHQALVRARCVSGDAELAGAFERVRARTLARARAPSKLAEDVVSMRLRMRAELDRSEAAQPDLKARDLKVFDLKQGAGGLVDLEFLLQMLVLRESATRPELLAARDTRALIAALRACGIFDDKTADALSSAHATLLGLGLECTLDRRARLASSTPAMESARRAVIAACAACGLRFDAIG